MNIPEEFKFMIRRFDQESIPQPFDERRWIEVVLRKLDSRTIDVSKAFLAEVLKDNLPGSGLQAIWEAGPPEYLLSDEHLRIFFRMVHEQL